ncbi:hypothetical protein LTSESEN_3870 [Salmonella enterica subsp. enterica serovar Senftenberg str. A4-543]|uniref:Uncharacterized protein n=1 Tax=Salmonella enterica subsp. enterica serovar Senftenberg str. A4-543 TaxID=913082 RepID=G5R337_SALSE|nr:hypothetical protein LTSESEN_3870 [Salmonella enterica subsp. enterica serovar Senftenberg str. A4-543]
MAGTISDRGYIVITINKKRLMAPYGAPTSMEKAPYGAPTSMDALLWFRAKWCD